MDEPFDVIRSLHQQPKLLVTGELDAARWVSAIDFWKEKPRGEMLRVAQWYGGDVELTRDETLLYCWFRYWMAAMP